MLRTTNLLPAAGLLVAAVGCHIDKLVDPPPSGAFIVSPSAVTARAAAGSSEPLELRLAVRGVHGDSARWSVGRSTGGDWLTLSDTTGTAPDTLHFAISPAGHAAGTYRDTLLLTPEGTDPVVTRVPVTLVLEGCRPGSLTIGTAVNDSLRATDCASSHRDGRPARRYRFTGNSGDSLSIRLSSPAFPVVLFVDTAASDTAPSLATATDCGAIDGACLRYLRLPTSGVYTVEVTSGGTGAGTGPFTLLARRPGAPSGVDSLRQTRADSVSTVSAGGVTPDPEVVVRGVVRDPDIGDTLTLEVELRPIGTAFTGEVTATSAPTLSGATAFVRLTGLVDGTGYHWRSRVVDQTARATDWAAFGGNPESAPDLRVAIAADRLRFQQPPSTTAAGAEITPAVQVAAVDRDGAVVTTFSGTITLSLASAPPGATLSGKRSADAVDGVATFPGLSLDKAGSGYTLLAASSGTIDATSPSFAVVAGPAAHVTYTQQPSSGAPSAPITPAVVVTVTDGYGNVATSFTGTVTIALGHDGSLLGSAHLTGTLSVPAAAGVARFSDLRIDQVGTGYTLVAAVAGAGNVTSRPFDMVPLGGSATSQSFNGQPSGTTAGAPITPPVEVTIRDALGAVVTSFDRPVTMALTGGPPGAVLLGTATQVPSGGVARFSDLAVDRPGTGYRLRAMTPSLPDITSDQFDITAAPPTTGSIAITATTSGNDLDPDGYTVSVAGGGSRSIAIDGSTTFSALPPGTSQVALTGVAVNCVVGGDDPRSVMVTAGTTASTTFEVTCGPTTPPPPPATALRFLLQPPGMMIVGGTFGVLVSGVDAKGVLASSFTGRVTLTLSGALPGTTLTGTTAMNAAGGVAAFSDLHVTGPCINCVLVATATSLAEATSDPFTIVVPL